MFRVSTPGLSQIGHYNPQWGLTDYDAPGPPVSAQAAGVSVTQSKQVRIEYLSSIVSSRPVRWENLVIIVKSRSLQIEELITTLKGRSTLEEYLASVSTGRILPIEVFSTVVAVATGRILPMEYLSAVIKGHASSLEYLGKIMDTASVQIEELVAPTKGRSEAIEILKGLSIGKSPILEYLRVKSSGRTVSPEWLLRQSASDSMLPEYLVRARKDREAILEILKGISSGRSLPFEYTGAAQITITGSHTLSVEWRSSVSKGRSFLFDLRSIVSKSRTLILDWLSGLSATLDPSSYYANIVKSLNKYLTENLIDTEALVLDWGQAGFKAEGLERWVQSRLIWGDRDFVRQADFSGEMGNLVDVQVEIDLFEKHPARRNLYAMDDDKDTALEYLVLAAIPVYDFEAAGNPQVGEIRLYAGAEDILIEDGEKTGLRQQRLVIPGRYLEKFTTD